MRFQAHPQEWHEYHDAYREAVKAWQVIPYQEAIEWLQQRPHWVVGDFGCGEAFITQQLKNTVYSFDHVAINDRVVACDMKNVDLQSRVLDAAIFSLSLMGSNYGDYIREAHRCLKLDGYLWLAEPGKRIRDVERFRNLLHALGFDVVGIVEYKWKFIFVKAIKTGRSINEHAVHEILNTCVLS